MERIEVYKKTNSKLNLIMGTLWIVIGCISFFTIENQISFFKYFWIILGFLYFLLYFNDKKPFIIIEKNIIFKPQFPKSQFNLNNLQRINRNKNGYTLVSTTQNNFKITTSILKEEDNNKLKLILEEYEAKTTKQ